MDTSHSQIVSFHYSLQLEEKTARQTRYQRMSRFPTFVHSVREATTRL